MKRAWIAENGKSTLGWNGDWKRTESQKGHALILLRARVGYNGAEAQSKLDLGGELTTFVILSTYKSSFLFMSRKGHDKKGIYKSIRHFRNIGHGYKTEIPSQ